MTSYVWQQHFPAEQKAMILNWLFMINQLIFQAKVAFLAECPRTFPVNISQRAFYCRFGLMDAR